MARRSSGGRSARPALLRRSAPAPVRQAPPPPAHSGSGEGIGSAFAQGMGVSAGFEIATRIVDSLFGPRTIRHETVVSAAPAPTANTMGGRSDANCNVHSKALPPAVPPANTMVGSDACNIHSKAFQDCINNFGSDISKCQFYMDMLSDCKKNSSGMLISP